MSSSAMYRRLRAFAGRRLARFRRPSFIAFLLTERCNARCLHCDIWKNRGVENSPGADEWKRVLGELRSWLGPVPLVFTGGEMLLYPGALDLVEYAISLGFRLEVLTNGYCADQRKFERLALAGPWRITISVDGVGAAHSKIRGREDFFERVSATLDTLLRVKSERNLPFRVLLKTVIMAHNLDQLGEIARFAARLGSEVMYQPIEQNYNTPNDPYWFRSSPNWPDDAGKAVDAVRRLIELKRAGLPIVNSGGHFDAMIRYFEDPVGMGAVTRAHVADSPRPFCGAATSLQFQANGDVASCANRPPIGNIRDAPIRRLWFRRPSLWSGGRCCLLDPLPAAETPSGAALRE